MSLRKLAAIVAALVVGLGTASAAGRDSLNVDLGDETSLAGTTLPAGRYKITWTAGAAETEVKISQGKKVIATAKAKRVEREAAPREDQVVSRKGASGAFAIAEIRLKGEKAVLVL
jgi:hypothetical protein